MLSDIAGTPDVITDPRCSVEGRPFEQRFYPNPEVQLIGTTTRNTSKTTTLHFPGKAFGLLPLRRMLQDNMCPVATLCISCGCVCRRVFGGILGENSTCPPSVSISRIKMFSTAY